MEHAQTFILYLLLPKTSKCLRPQTSHHLAGILIKHPFQWKRLRKDLQLSTFTIYLKTEPITVL